MKQILEKFQNVFLEGLEKLENENIAEALQKFKEVSGIFPELLEKTSKAELELKKYAELIFINKRTKKIKAFLILLLFLFLSFLKYHLKLIFLLLLAFYLNYCLKYIGLNMGLGVYIIILNKSFILRIIIFFCFK